MQWAVKQKGFTVVELLIVIVVIAILAAITIVSYNGVTRMANESTVQSSIQSVRQKIATYATEHAESYPASLADIGISDTNLTTFDYVVNTSTNPQGYCLVAKTTSAEVTYRFCKNYTYTYNGVATTLNDTTSQKGTWPGYGEAPAVIITNYALNPSFEDSVTFSTTAPNGSTRTSDTSRANSGTTSARIGLPAGKTMTNVGVGVFNPSSFTSVGLEPGETYTASAYVYIPSGSPSIQVSIQGSGRASATNLPPQQTYTKDQWVRIYRTFTLKSSDGSISVYFLNNETTPGTTTQFWIDSIMITKGTEPPNYADGNSNGWSWSGSPNVSQSSGPTL